MDESRKQFEDWLCSQYSWGVDTLNKSFFQGDEISGYYLGGDFVIDGKFRSESLYWAWRGWQASRQALQDNQKGD